MSATWDGAPSWLSAARWAPARRRSSAKSRPYWAQRTPSPARPSPSSISTRGANNRRIYHFDFYRIDDIREAYDFGYEEYFYSGDLCLVEWPEKIEQLLPENVMTVRITVDSDTARTFEIE